MHSFVSSTVPTVLAATLILAVQVACGLTCEERAEYAEAYIDQAVAVNQRCSYDEDCVNITIVTACGNLCTEAVNIEGIPKIESAVDHVNQAWCEESQEMGCGFDNSTCDAPDRARCTQGICDNSPF